MKYYTPINGDLVGSRVPQSISLNSVTIPNKDNLFRFGIVDVYICLVYCTHLYVNLGFVIKRVVTPYVPKTGNLSMSVVSSSISKTLFLEYLNTSHNFKLRK
jgi:hypothetical protein